MDLRERWLSLDELCRCAERYPTIELWAFGSMLWSHTPRDLDVLVVYNYRPDVIAMRAMGLWEVAIPRMDIIAMTSDEEQHYGFIKLTGAIRLHPAA